MAVDFHAGRGLSASVDISIRERAVGRSRTCSPDLPCRTHIIFHSCDNYSIIIIILFDNRFISIYVLLSIITIFTSLLLTTDRFVIVDRELTRRLLFNVLCSHSIYHQYFLFYLNYLSLLEYSPLRLISP